MHNVSTELPVPAARTTDLVVTHSSDDVLVYDQQQHHIHHLNPTAATVWPLCDGRRTIVDVARAAAIDEETVRLALRKLDDVNLLRRSWNTAIQSNMHSRRAFFMKAAVTGAVALPTIVSITAPRAAAAESTTCVPYRYPCSTHADCYHNFLCVGSPKRCHPGGGGG